MFLAFVKFLLLLLEGFVHFVEFLLCAVYVGESSLEESFLLFKLLLELLDLGL